MVRIPTPTTDELSDAEIEDALESTVLAYLPDTIAILERCTLTHLSLLRSGLGWEVKFLMPLSERTKLADLSLALQRSVTVTVERSHKRTSTENGTS